jgi:hypothetical protein
MPIVKRLMCLANSRKLSGRCVAGKELVASGPGLWVCPVSDRPAEEVSERERHYEGGRDPEVLDIVDIPLKNHHPKSYQSENWLLDPNFYWVRAGRASWNDLIVLRENPTTLWVSGSSTFNGLNDRVSLSDSAQLTNSLYLLYLDRIKLRVFAPGEPFGNPKRRVSADFLHGGTSYILWVTDPVIEGKYLARNNGEYSTEECFVTVSLGEPHKGYCYKLVATLITPDRANGPNL